MLHCLELYTIHFILTSYIQHSIRHKNWHYITVSSQQSFWKAKITNIFFKRSFAFGTCATLKKKINSLLKNYSNRKYKTQRLYCWQDSLGINIYIQKSHYSAQKLNLHCCFISTKLLQSKDNKKLYIRRLALHENKSTCCKTFWDLQQSKP